MRHAAVCAAALLAACGASEPRTASLEGQEAGCASRAYSEIGGPISLVDQTGAPRTEADFKGAPSLVYFGFTFCPDVCPSTLVTIDRALRRLPDEVEKPRTILISVDPERDTPDALESYLSTDAFPDKMVGLTGDPGQAKAAADAFKAWYQRVETPESAAGYTMDHSSIVYLMDEDWSLQTFFITAHETDETMAACLASQLG